MYTLRKTRNKYGKEDPRYDKLGKRGRGGQKVVRPFQTDSRKSRVEVTVKGDTTEGYREVRTQSTRQHTNVSREMKRISPYVVSYNPNRQCWANLQGTPVPVNTKIMTHIRTIYIELT